MNNINEPLRADAQYGERFSFFGLFEKKGYKISVPIIQRDYAQGRETTKEIRNNFLDALFDYLEENRPFRDLDFIYGSLSYDDCETVFIPLDGQQRLTTLFLLHWYLCQISENESLKARYFDALIKNGKSMFSYETRASSAEFCDALMNSTIDCNNLVENTLSKTIKNCSWFYLSWKHDPTIQSMLTMLDAIHGLFQGKGYYFERLLDDDFPVITFLFLNLEDFQLTDDLYIKMNSRGKPLTSFENFKAKFEQSLDCTDTGGRIFSLQFNNGLTKAVSLKKYFSFNIDTKWANLFWKYKSIIKKNSVTFDEVLENFIRVIFTSQYAIDSETKGKDNNLDYLLGRNYFNTSISYHRYRDLDVVFDKDKEEKLQKALGINETDIERLKKLASNCALAVVDALDCFSNGNESIKHFIDSNYTFYYDEERSFENALKNNFDNNHQRLCFHAYTRYLITNKGNTSGINEWMRVIHNLSHPENTIIDETASIVSAVKSIEKMLPYSNDILSYLCTNPNLSFFSSWQVQEEIIKAHLITKSDNWRNAIESVEKHGYFNGQVCFLFEFAGILSYFKQHNNCNWNEKEDAAYFNSFMDYKTKASLVFANSYDDRIDMRKNYVFERAVLTKGEYFMFASSCRRNMLSSKAIYNIKRDHSWKRFLRVYENEATISSSRNLVKQVFDDKRLDSSNIWRSLELVCESLTNTWRDYFIQCPELFEYCRQGFIRVEGNNILLLGESQTNHYHAELHTYYLWIKYFRTNESKFYPFSSVDYYCVKSIDENPQISFSSFWFKHHQYEMSVEYKNGFYTIRFKHSFFAVIDSAIINILGKHDFANASYSSIICIKDDKDLLALINAIVKDLAELKKEEE